MDDKQLVEFAREFREGILGGRESRSMCAAVCWPLVGLLSFQGIKARAVESDLGDTNHVWIKLADGRVLDPTADQFNGLGFVDLPDVYLGPRLEIHGEGASRE